MKPPVFILGYMACGKTTFGRALARALGREFIDMDFRIEQRYRKTIKELFAERWWPAVAERPASTTTWPR